MALKVWGAGSTQGLDGLWDTASNWDDDTAPVDGDSLLFNETALYAMTSGPGLASVIIENIEVTSLALIPSMYGTRAIIVTGQLNSAPTSGFPLTISIFPHGITSIVGQWFGNFTIPNDRSGDFSTAYLGISEVLFTSSNYLELSNIGYGSANELKYGTSDISLTLSGQAPFTSFKFSSVGGYPAFQMSGVMGLTSQLIEFDNAVMNFSFAGSNFNLNCPLINIVQMGPLTQYDGSTPSVLSFTQLCTLNISSNNPSYYPNPINDNLIFLFNQHGDINLYGEATIYGTSSSSFMPGMGGSTTAVLLQGTSTMNVYDNSLVGGIYSGSGFVDGYFGLSSYYSCNVIMRDNSVFQGIVMGGMASSITFLNSSNISFSYQYDKQNNSFQAYPSSVLVGGGDIPQSLGGLTVFKSSF